MCWKMESNNIPKSYGKGTVELYFGLLPALFHTNRKHYIDFNAHI